MNVKEFATKHVGKTLHYAGSPDRASGWCPSYPDPSGLRWHIAQSGRIIGYNTHLIIIEPEHDCGWIRGECKGPDDVFLLDAKRAWRVALNEWVLKEEGKPSISIFKHVCKYCHAKARKCGSAILCANNCKASRKSIKNLCR